MSERVKGFYVSLSNDVSEEHFKEISNAVLMIKGVGFIKESITDSNDWMNRTKIKRQLIADIYEVLK